MLSRLASLGIILIAIATLACASGGTTPEIEMGPGAEVTDRGLHRVRNSSYDDEWVKPNANLASYSEILFEFVSISYESKPDSSRYVHNNGNFALSGRRLERLERYLTEAFEAELSGDERYRLVDVPGPRTLRVSARILDLVVGVPETHDRRGREEVYTSSTAEMTLELELYDSVSGEILARATDRREARAPGYFRGTLYQSNAVRDTDAFRREFQRWARLFRAQLDSARSVALRAVVREQEPQERHPDDR